MYGFRVLGARFARADRHDPGERGDVIGFRDLVRSERDGDRGAHAAGRRRLVEQPEPGVRGRRQGADGERHGLGLPARAAARGPQGRQAGQRRRPDRQRLPLVVEPVERVGVGVADAGRHDFDQDFPGLGAFQIDFDDFKRLLGRKRNGGAGLHGNGAPLRRFRNL